MDIKKLGRIPDGGGWRAHGRGAGSIQRDRSTKVGYDYVHSLIDDHSRLAYSEILPDEKGATCAGFLQRAIDYFAAHGIAQIERLMTDNAGPTATHYERFAPHMASPRSSSNPIAPGRTEKSSG